jgi:hypothetical protein
MPKNHNQRNVRNEEHILFKKLTKLLSGPIVNFKAQSAHNIRREKLIKYTFKSASGKHFKKEQYNPFDNLQLDVMANQMRTERYRDFNQMEYVPEIASALDIYADEMTTHTNLQPLLNIKCPNEEIKEVLHTLFYDILNIEFNLYQWCRTMCKFGDYFLYLDIDEELGVRSGIGLPQAEVERLEGQDKTNPNYVQYQWNAAGLTFENWQVGHFRILGNDKFYPYGTSVLDASRRIFRQLILLEDSMMAYRIVRAPERRVFYIDVGNIPPQDVETYMQEVITAMKRNQIVDSQTGRVDLRYNPMSIDEDYYIPVRGQQSTRIEPLAGGQYVGDIDDVKYLRDKLFSALKIPQAYLSSDNVDEDKTTLSQKDIRFARTIQRLQRSVISELEKIGIIHLYILGFRNEDLINFTVSLNNPSKLAELQDLEHWRTRFDVASAATEGFFSRRWISEHLFNMSEEDILRNQREMFYDKDLERQLGAVAEGGGDVGGGDFESELEGAEGTEEETPEEGEETLLASPENPPPTAEETPPAKRDDESYLTPGSKGKMYTPVKDDKRNMGARKRHMMATYNNEKSSKARRNIFHNSNEIASLTKGISENDQTIYINEQKDILDQSSEIRTLVENLDKIPRKDDKKIDLSNANKFKSLNKGNKNESKA